MSTDSRLQTLKSNIVQQVTNHWNETATALLLTSLGSNLKRFYPDYKDIIPDGLQSFISDSQCVQLVAHPEVSQKIGLIPLGVTIPEDPRALFEARQRQRPPTSFRKDFWEAFHLPTSGRRRFVVIPSGAGRQFEIHDLDTEPAGRFYEITTEDVIVNDGSPLPELVKRKRQSIDRWLARNGLDPAEFSVDSVAPGATPRSATAAAKDIGILARLEQQDQARILIPLDILVKLLQ
jgi:hypothetical protein